MVASRRPSASSTPTSTSTPSSRRTVTVVMLSIITSPAAALGKRRFLPASRLPLAFGSLLVFWGFHLLEGLGIERLLGKTTPQNRACLPQGFQLGSAVCLGFSVHRRSSIRTTLSLLFYPWQKSFQSKCWLASYELNGSEQADDANLAVLQKCSLPNKCVVLQLMVHHSLVRRPGQLTRPSTAEFPATLLRILIISPGPRLLGNECKRMNLDFLY